MRCFKQRERTSEEAEWPLFPCDIKSAKTFTSDEVHVMKETVLRIYTEGQFRHDVNKTVSGLPEAVRRVLPTEETETIYW